MELLLWRVSAVVQVTSVVLIVAFLAALARSAPRAALRWWVMAWLANLSALVVSIVYLYLDPPPWSDPIVRALYLGAKTLFALWLVQGAWTLLRPGGGFLRARRDVPLITAFMIAGAVLLHSVDLIGIGQQLVIFLLFAWAAIALARSRDGSLTWLATAFAIRALLALAEMAAYGVQVLPRGVVSPEFRDLTTLLLSAHFSFDAGTEWLLALAGVLALSDRSQRELQANNAQLLAAQEDLRRLVDRDPLTALANRRSLAEVFRAVQPAGATLLFFDLDDFKQINDLHGHQTGDECLKRFAVALRDSFRPDDAVIRYAGDEFLVVGTGLDRANTGERLNALRGRLQRVDNCPPIHFSVGIADLAAGGQPEAALEAADKAMYRAKAAAHRRHLRLLKVGGNK